MTAQELRTRSDPEIRELLAADPTLIEQKFGRGESLLHRVVVDGRVELTKWLVGEHPQLLEMSDTDGNTALHSVGDTLYLEHGKEGELAFEISEILLSGGASVFKRNRKLETPLLHLSYRANACEGFLKTLGSLLKADSDPNAQDSVGNTYLHLLAEESDMWDSLPIAKLLLDAGADPKIQNGEGKTPAEVALFTKSTCETEHAVEFIAFIEGHGQSRS